MLARIFGAALLALFVVTSAQAAPPKDAKDFMKHLKKEGYTCEKGDNFVTANHDVQLNLVMKAYNGGVLVQTYAGSNVKDRDEIVDTVNALNRNATVTRFYIDGDGDTMIEAWYPGEYDKKHFEAFLEAWQGDTKGQGAVILTLVQ